MKINRTLLFASSGVMIVQLALFYTGCSDPPKETEAKAEVKPALMNKDEMIARGEYLVTISLCNDCHTPKIMTPQGPEIDSTRLLAGSPHDIKLPKIDLDEITPGKWYLGSSDLTAWVGPWGISFAANLTPDKETGSGTWTEELFIKMLRTGKFMGVDAGRPIMPPMPWQFIGKMTDEDLKCVFAYLQSLPAIKNSVPAYIPPNEIASLK